MEQSAAPQLLPIQTGPISESTPKLHSKTKEGGVSFHDLFSESIKNTSAKRTHKSDSDDQPVLAIGDLKIPLDSLKKDKDGHFILSLDDLKKLLNEAQKQGLIDAKQAKAIESGESSLASLLIQGSENGELFTLSVQDGKGVLTAAPKQGNPTASANLNALQIQSALQSEANTTSDVADKTTSDSVIKQFASIIHDSAKTSTKADAASTRLSHKTSRGGDDAKGADNANETKLKTASEKNVEAAVNRLDQLENKGVETLKKRLNNTDSALLMRKEGEIQTERQALESKIEQSRLAHTSDDIKKEIFQGEVKSARQSATELTSKQLKSNAEATAKANTTSKPVVNAEVKLASHDNAHYDLRDTSKGVLDDAALRILLGKSESDAETKTEIKQNAKSVQAIRAEAVAANKQAEKGNTSNEQSQDQQSSKKENGSFKQVAKAELDKGALDAMSDKPTAAPKANHAQSEAVAKPDQASVAQTASESRPVEANAPTKATASAGSIMQDRVEKIQEATAQQIVRGVKGAISADRSDITIRLTPQSLGRVSIQLMMEHGQLTANLTAQKEATQAMLEKNIHLLKHALDDNNVKVDKINIIREPQDAKQQSEQQRERSQDDRNSQQRGSQQEQQSNQQRNNNQRWNWNEYWNSWNNWRQTT
ncbi:flagellar hook-length control protein FliK [bacterium]|nr:flagellar hook-length control protein FliK [bacterium]